MKKASSIFYALFAVTILQGCMSISKQCLFRPEIYDIQQTVRSMALQDGTVIEVIGNEVFFPVAGNSGRLSAPDGIHILASGDKFKTLDGHLAYLEDCPFH